MTLYTLFLGFLLLLHAVSAALPQVDYNRMGKVGLVGAFAGLDISDKSAASFDPTTATLLLRDRIGGLSRLGSTNPGGAITSGCALRDVYFFGGSFTSIGGISANNVASYSPSSATFAPLGSDGPNGQVSAMYCDEKESKVWVGGHFTSPGSSVALWDVTASAWSRAPFGGLAGAGAQVNSITANSSQSSIFFAGSFLTSFSGGPVVINGTNNPNIPFSAGATPFSSSLVPVPLQSAEVAGSPPSPDSQFSSIQAILCPSGPDGPGNTWLAEGGNTAVITARTFTFMNGHGIRLGNTFQSGHGTTGFSVTTIPDNAVQRLNYLDPTTSQNRSCTDPCPLLSDPSIPYQDFLFDTPLFITGVQVKLSEYTGSGPGLHLFQILSSGAFASALDDQNGLSCFAPNPSNTTRTGGWSEKLANTNIPGTTQNVLVSTVDAGTPVSQAPSFTWIPYVSAAGEYDVNLLVPGCTNFQDCDRRTSVQVTVFPGQGLQPWVTTISQRNTEDASSLVYSGPIVPSSPDFVATVTMTLADGAGEAGSSFELVADRVQLLLKSANVSSSGATGGGPGAGSRIGSTGFGFFEWTRVATSVDATATLPNSTRTLSDNIGFELFQGARGLTSNTVLAVAHHGSGAVFIGGRFQLSSGSTNIAVYRNGNLAALSENGLNGPVTSLALDGDKLYVGGSFTDTGSGSAQGRLSRIASYDIQQSQWSALQAGVNGDVSSLAITNGQVQVAGNFTRLLGSIEGESDAAGFSAWDISSGSWVSTGGFVMGKLSLVGNGTKSGQGQSQFIAGNIAASLKYGGSGFVMLENGKDQPAIAPLAPRLAGDVAAGRSGSAASRRELARRGPAAWMPLITDIFSRQAVPPTTPLPAPLPAAAPAVLAGAFWTNSSTSKEVVIVGGNFSFASRGVKSQSVGIYDPESSRLTALQGPQVAGIVRALLVVDDSLYVGGQFTLEGTNVNGLAIYDLNNQQWDVSGLQPLQSRSASLIVRSITAPSLKGGKVIVAGSFSQAGALQCQSICSLDTGSKQWNALGNGVQGEVASVAYAGHDNEVLVASGSMALSGSAATTNVMQFSFSNSTWSTIGSSGELPGPVTALEVNNGNASSIFAAGKSSDGTSPFLSFWDGKSWRNLGSTLQGASTVAQLLMVPLQDTHAKNDVIEPDRMLMVSGSLAGSSFGVASSALFDGESFIPYITTASTAGTPGSIFALFHSFATFSFTQRRILATGVVILISIAIAAGVVFFFALLGILWTLFSRKDDKLVAAEPDEDDDSVRHRPSSLLEHINAATRTTILGAKFGNPNNEKEEDGVTSAALAHTSNEPFGPDSLDFARAETPSDAVGGILAAEGEMSRPAHARYSFDGGGEGELPLTSGQEVEVLDDRDAAWWYARDTRTGREGVVPAAYLY